MLIKALLRLREITWCIIVKMQVLCKACGRNLADDAKERRPLTGKQYNALHTIVAASSPSLPASLVHTNLAKSPSYVCKSCYSVLTKYGNIAKEIEDMQQRFQDSFFSSQSTSEVSSEQYVDFFMEYGLFKQGPTNHHSVTAPATISTPLHQSFSPQKRRSEKRGCNEECPEVVKRVKLQVKHVGARKVLFPVQLEPSAQQPPAVTVSIFSDL